MAVRHSDSSSWSHHRHGIMAGSSPCGKSSTVRCCNALTCNKEAKVIRRPTITKGAAIIVPTTTTLVMHCSGADGIGYPAQEDQLFLLYVSLTTLP